MMKKFPKVKYPNHSETDGLLDGEVVVTEKIDGANFRFTIDENDELYVGTRNHTFHHEDENIPKAFRHAVEYVENVAEEWSLPRDVTFYGEAMHRHSLDYEGIDWHVPNKGSPHVPLDSDHPNVVLFDARRNGEWMDWDDFVETVKYTGFKTTRVLERGETEELTFDVPEESMFGGQPEGIVIRRKDGTVRAKKVTDEFKEQNAQTFEDPSKAQSDAGAFVSRYMTEARIKKNAHKLVDEDEYDGLCMEMMEDLPQRVIIDAIEENAWKLMNGDDEYEWDNDFKHEVRSKTSKKCARKLKSTMQELSGLAE